MPGTIRNSPRFCFTTATPEISLYTLDGYEILLGNADEKKMDYIKIYWKI